MDMCYERITLIKREERGVVSAREREREEGRRTDRQTVPV